MSASAGPLQVFQAIVLLCCISSSCLTLFLLSPDLMAFILEGTTNTHTYIISVDAHSIPCTGSTKGQAKVLGQPFPVLWSVVLLLGLIVHTAEIIVCRTLVRAWAPRHGKRA